MNPLSSTLQTVAPGLQARGLALPLNLADYRLIAFDMDATLITVESMDEIAECAGLRTSMAAMTAAAMRGEGGDYAQNLRKRVGMLAGVPESVLETVWRERIRPTPGAETLIQACKAAGLRCILVTSGFTWFAEKLKTRLQLDDLRANVLEIADGRLTGKLLPQPWGDCFDGEGKRQKVLETCAQMGIGPEQAIAVGDGANDLPMIRTAGLSVAFHGKPVLRAEARVAIDEGGLDRLLELFARA
ncbi:phosphoserine phosphatase SerB [Paracandidimonas soli]|uniref:phosphoserine phosphatase SerB n=1 Tax=Paracandidimonas soli TaxID=1917182 RepID=UPI00333E5F27